MRTMDDLVNAKKRASHHAVPCLEYKFGGVCRGISFCDTCGFPGFEHDISDVESLLAICDVLFTDP